MQPHNFTNPLPVVELYGKCGAVVSFSLCLDISVGEPRGLSRFLILLDLEARVVIGVTTETRNQTPKAMFCVTYCSLPSKEKESSSVFTGKV